MSKRVFEVVVVFDGESCSQRFTVTGGYPKCNRFGDRHYSLRSAMESAKKWARSERYHVEVVRRCKNGWVKCAKVWGGWGGLTVEFLY